MYYYKISSYIPYDSHEDIVVAHKCCFDDYSLSVMVQDVIDKYINKYSLEDEYSSRRKPCRMSVSTLFPLIIISGLQEMYDFKPCPIMAKTSIEDGHFFYNNDIKQPFLFNRYSNKILGQCNECHRDKCVVLNKRRGDKK